MGVDPSWQVAKVVEGPPGTQDGPRMARSTFTRIDTRFKDLLVERKFQVKRTRDAIRGYFVSNQEVIQDHARLVEQGKYSRHELHVRMQRLQQDLVKAGQPSLEQSSIKDEIVKVAS